MSGFSIGKFRSPDAEFYPGYFWVLNSPMTADGLLEMLRDMNAHGARSICIHPSPRNWSANSLATPDYLSAEYLELMDKLHAEADRLGMHSYFYDEGGFPSGTSVGEVLASDPERFSRKFVMKDEKTGEYAVKDEREFGSVGLYPPKGYPNLLEKGVGERFIELSHEKLKTALGGYFGRTILYTFDDEAALPGYFGRGRAGWCSDFGEEFFRRKGYRIEPFFRDIVSTPADDEAGRHLVDYCDVRSQLFVERFFIPLRDWARANGLGSGGHLGGENVPEGNLYFCYGHIIRAMRAMDLPGVDVIWRQIFPKILPARKNTVIHNNRFDAVSTGAEDAPFTKYASSVARQAGHGNVLSEDFAAYGAGLTPQVMKFVIDHQLIRGANHFVFSNIPHGYHGRLLSAGCRPKFGKYHPFWDWFDMIHCYTARMSSLLHMGRPAADVLVYFDVRSIWRGGRTMERAVAVHLSSAGKLLSGQIDFDFADDDALSGGTVSGDRFKVGRMVYRTLVIPPTGWMERKAAAKVELFRKAGGRVLSTDQIGEIEPVLRIAPVSPSLRAVKRICGKETLYFIVNESPRPVKCRLTVPEPGEVQLYDAWSGKRYRVGRSGREIPWKFAPFGSAALVVGASRKADGGYPLFRPGRRRIRLDDGWSLRPARKCCFDRESYSIKAVDGGFVPVRLGDWSEVLGRWFSGEAVYRVEFDSPSDAPAMLSLGEVRYVCEAMLNGISVGRSFSDAAEFLTAGALKKGRNVLEVRVVNTPANSVLDPEVMEYWDKNHPPSEYQAMNRAFEEESLDSGLFGPVEIRFAAGDRR